MFGGEQIIANKLIEKVCLFHFLFSLPALARLECM